MPRYFMFNKPKGCVTARTDSLSKTVMDYFPEECRQTMYPVGRLDKDTEGLLLITDDGMLCRKLLLPKSHVPKTYFFYAIGELTEEKVSAISEGVEMKGRELPALPARARELSPTLRNIFRTTKENVCSNIPGRRYFRATSP